MILQNNVLSELPKDSHSNSNNFDSNFHNFHFHNFYNFPLRC